MRRRKRLEFTLPRQSKMIDMQRTRQVTGLWQIFIIAMPLSDYERAIKAVPGGRRLESSGSETIITKLKTATLGSDDLSFFRTQRIY